MPSNIQILFHGGEDGEKRGNIDELRGWGWVGVPPKRGGGLTRIFEKERGKKRGEEKRLPLCRLPIRDDENSPILFCDIFGFFHDTVILEK